MILDTCALLFLATGDPRLTQETRELLSRQPQRWFSAISGFEISLKHQQGKLVLPLPPAQWLRQIAQRYVLTELALNSTVCLEAGALPFHHRDPCDRFIIASALQLRVSVVTTDKRFELYGVKVLN